MKLNAKRKKEQPVPEVQVPPTEAPLDKGSEYPYSITIQCNTLLYKTLQNMITSAHAAGDFSYASASDIIRAAIQAYKDGMQLTVLDEDGDREYTSIRLTAEQHQFYKSLPNRLKRKIIERAIRSYLKLRLC